MSEVDTTGNVDQGQQPATLDSSSTPTPIELSDDSLVKLPGSEKPVKYGEWFRGFQSKHTKATMALSDAEKRLVEYERRLAERQSQPQQTGQPKASPFEALRSRAYLSGEEAAQILEQVVTGHQSELGRRDQVLKLMVGKLQQMDQVLNGLNGNYAQNRFQSKIKSVLGELGLPDEAADLAQEIYLAYEGDNLDQEFPQILKNRWEQIVSLARKLDQQKVKESRQARFVPGKGPIGSTGKPLDLSRSTAKEAADALWSSLQGEDT